MSSTTQLPAQRVSLKRVGTVGLMAIAAAVIANSIIRLVAVSALGMPAAFPPFAWGQFIFLTVVGVGLGVITFAGIARWSKRPIRTFRIVAGIALLVSFLPDFGLLAGASNPDFPVPGVSLLTVGTLMFMHVVSAAICVGMLTTMTVEK